MKHPSLETIPVQLVAGKLSRTDSEVFFENRVDQTRVAFSPAAEAFLQSFIKGQDIETIVLDHLSRGAAVDYRLLKSTFLRLFHAGCLKNEDEFRPFVAAWKSAPLPLPRLTVPFVKSSMRMATSSGLTLPILLSLALLSVLMFIALPTMVQFTMGLPNQVQVALFVLLYPSACLSLMAGFAWFLNQFFVQEGTTSQLRFSAIGVYFDPDLVSVRRHSSFLFLFSSLLVAFLPLILTDLKILRFAPPSFQDIFASFGLLIFALLTLPGFHNPVSSLRSSRKASEWVTAPVLDFIVSSLVFILSCLSILAAFAFLSETIFHGITLMRRIASQGLAPNFIVVMAWLVAAFWSANIAFDLTYALTAFTKDEKIFSSLHLSARNLIARIMGSDAHVDYSKLKKIFSSHPLLALLPPDVQILLMNRSQVVYAPSGTRVIRQTSETRDLFLLLSGSVGVYRRNPSTKRQHFVLSIRSGSLFGETGFFLNESRTADVICIEDSFILRIRKPKELQMQKTVQQSEDFRKKIWASQTLCSHPFFEDLPSESILQILNHAKVVQVPAQTTIIREGSAADSLWICIQGSAKVESRGIERPMIAQGAVLGEIGLIWNIQRTATVTTNEESIFLRLGVREFRTLLSQNLFFAARLQKLGQERLDRDQSIRVA